MSTPENTLRTTMQDALVILRPLDAKDFDALYAVARDPLIWAQHQVPDRHRAPVFMDFFRQAIEARTTFIIYDAGSGAVIGSSGYYNYDPELRELTIGYTFFARSHWGGAYNGAVKQMMLDHAFRFVDKVYFDVGPGNLRSQNALKKIGAQPAESTDPSKLRFVITKEEWERRALP